MKLLLLSLLMVSFGYMSVAQTPDLQLRKKHFWLNKNGVAMDGYDPVSYFTTKPQQGKAEFAFTQNGVNYWFANAKNRDTFKANPAKYEPAFGGWCSYAVGVKAEKVEPDPENFKIVNGKVNLFFKNFFSNTIDDWNKDEVILKKQAEQNWATKIYK